MARPTQVTSRQHRIVSSRAVGRTFLSNIPQISNAPSIRTAPFFATTPPRACPRQWNVQPFNSLAIFLVPITQRLAEYSIHRSRGPVGIPANGIVLAHISADTRSLKLSAPEFRNESRLMSMISRLCLCLWPCKPRLQQIMDESKAIANASTAALQIGVKKNVDHCANDTAHHSMGSKESDY
jgi:hypothetical protein